MQKVKVKICGLTNPEDAVAACHLGADAIGLVFYPPSSRFVTAIKAQEIAQVIPPFVQRVGLFVNPETKEVNDILRQVDLDLLQFHGDETPGFCESFNKPYIKALSMKDGLDVNRKMQEYKKARGFLLDTYHPEKPGGTGMAFNWAQFPHNTGKYLILAGGLTAENVADAITICRPYAVDVSGGVELSPGIKSVEKMQTFINKAKSIEGLL